MPSVDSETRSEIKRIADYLNKKKSAKTLNTLLTEFKDAEQDEMGPGRSADAFNKAMKYVKENFGKEGALFNLGPKIVKQKPSAKDERLGITKTKKKKRDPQTTAENKAKGNPITAQGQVDKIKDSERNFYYRLNLEAPATVAETVLGGIDRNPRKNLSGFDSESKERKVRGFTKGGLVQGKKFSGIY